MSVARLRLAPVGETHVSPMCPLLRGGEETSRFPHTPSPAHRPKVGL
jgi:hypothetical protein